MYKCCDFSWKIFFSGIAHTVLVPSQFVLRAPALVVHILSPSCQKKKANTAKKYFFLLIIHIFCLLTVCRMEKVHNTMDLDLSAAARGVWLVKVISF